MAQGNPISSRLLKLFQKNPRPTVADENVDKGYNDDPIAHGHERGYEPNWKEFSHDPMRPKIQLRRQRYRKVKHPT